MTASHGVEAAPIATPYMVHSTVEGYLRFPCAMLLWYAFLVGTLAPFRHSGGAAAAHDSVLRCLLAWLPAYLCANGLFITTMFLLENTRCLFVRAPRRLSLADDYVHSDPAKVDKMVAFEYDTPIDTYERVKMFFFMVTGVAFVRAFTAMSIIFLGLFTTGVGGHLDRYAYPWWFGFWSRVTTLLSITAFAVLGVHNVRQYGQFAARSECKILIANHSCVMEVIWFFIMGGFPSFVSRKENLSFAFFGNVVRASSSILVDRDAATSREQTLRAIVQRAGDPSAPQLMIFPEGTTANQQSLFMFKKGVFEAAAPVQMVCIAFPYQHFNPAWTGRGVDGNSLWDIMLRLCCQFVTYAEVRLLPVYHPTEEERKDSKLYASHCQRMMAAVLREKISDASFSDYKEAFRYFAEKKKKNR
ncbi:Acyltransferase [Novymonas esmeraldas]|uniref:Acyltransferase n=1 Tax=Novymonas esmeraldas TaxID=1808958 RepID=A0AAW0F4U0_9TRYP